MKSTGSNNKLRNGNVNKKKNIIVPMCHATIRIPNFDIYGVRNKIKEIIATANCNELTVKGVRKMLEEWLGMRLSKYHREIKALIVDAM